MKSIASNALTLVTALLMSAGAAQAATTPTLAGDTIDASMNFITNSGYGLGRVSGYGFDAPFVVANGASDLKTFANAFTLDVDGTSFTLRFLATATFLAGMELKLTGLDFSNGGNLNSVSVATNLSGYSIGNSAHEVDIKLGNVAFNRNSYFTGTFNVAQVSAVPEPSSIALIALGLGVVGAVARRRA